jgi:hypothetical protein
LPKEILNAFLQGFPEQTFAYKKMIFISYEAARDRDSSIKEAIALSGPPPLIEVPEWSLVSSEIMDRSCEADPSEKGWFVTVVARFEQCRGITVKANDSDAALAADIPVAVFPTQLPDGWTFSYANPIEMSSDVEGSDQVAYDIDHPQIWRQVSERLFSGYGPS